MAGGNTFEVINAAEYNTTKFAKIGDLGSKVTTCIELRAAHAIFGHSYFLPPVIR
jgi:hypothetical protein